MSGCQHCGRRCQGRLCKDCGRDEYREDSLVIDENTENTDLLQYECTACGHEYEAASLGCPACGAQRGRYIGELNARV